MRRKIILSLLAITVIVSGCTGGNSDEQNAADRSISCSGLSLEIAYANGEQVTVVNLGDASFGNVTVAWNYENGNTVREEFETPAPGSQATFKSGTSGTISQVDVSHEECPSKNDSY